MWYALMKNNEIYNIKKFDITPTIFDFKCYLSSSNEYYIREIKEIILC